MLQPIPCHDIDAWMATFDPDTCHGRLLAKNQAMRAARMRAGMIPYDQLKGAGAVSESVRVLASPAARVAVVAALEAWSVTAVAALEPPLVAVAAALE